MKTILYNPIFINPQAYYVFPRLTRWLRPDNGYKEPANYIGQIEVTIIAYGEIGYTEYFEHTNYIDFTNFSNSYVRISLFTRLGSCVLGEWKIGAMESDRPYIEPEVLASLKAVVIVGDKTNQDKDRDTVANLVDASNPFVISNASYNLNSGYGLYAYDFTKWGLTKPPTTCIRETDKFTLTYVGTKVGKGVCIIETTNTSTSTIHVSFKVKISGIQDDTEGYFSNANNQHILLTNGINSIEMDVLTGHWYGFNFVKKDGSILGNCNIVVEQIPEFQGAFITDGVNDLIMSTKTVKQMGITDQITVVSMIHQISLNETYNVGLTNYIRSTGSFLRNEVKDTNKTGIYGYSASELDTTVTTNTKIINTVLGDKTDYGTFNKEDYIVDDSFFHVQNYTHDGIVSNEASSVAWYWTVISNKVLTTDQINQVIAYYDLDKYLEPTVLYNVKRQGLSNDTPASEWYLKDYSKNGYDMTLNNFSKAGGSGIAAKQGESIKDYSIIKDEEYQELTIYNEFKFKIKSKLSGRYWTVQYINRTNTSYPVTIVIDKDAYWVNSTTYYDADNNKQVIRKDIPIAADTPIDVLCCGYDQFDIPEDATSIVSAVSYINYNAVGEITVELIPSCEGGLITDRVNDFGKVTGLPAYKDYTTIIDYQRFDIGYIEGKGTTGILSKAHAAGQDAFLMNLIGSTGTHMNSYSFGTANANTYTDLDRQIYYQTKYKMQGFDMTAGTGVDGDSMWLALVRDNDSRFFNGVFYSLLMFPYSMSEFLIERQLKKYELGTLYPGMVEFRPVVEPDERIKSISYYIDLVGATPGNYYPIGSGLGIAVELEAPYKVNQLKINGVPAIPNADHKGFNATLDSNTPQKITMDIVVDETLVQWNPIVQSNVVLNTAPSFAIRGTSTILKAGDWIPKNSEIWVIVTMNDLVDELNTFTVNDTNITIPSSSYNPSTGKYGFPFTIDNKSLQQIDITIDEYIRFEDIVQPYPLFITLRNEDKTGSYSWGSKFKVGTKFTITFDNLLEGLYSANGGRLYYNGKVSSPNDRPETAEKTMEFTYSVDWTKDGNEPTAWLSPRLLRMPNSSYKYLGYIPDITGHGNHGYIKNSLYAANSGANYYRVDYNDVTIGANPSNLQFEKDDYRLQVYNSLDKRAFIILKVRNSDVALASYKVKITGLKEGDTIKYFYNTSTTDANLEEFNIAEDGEYLLPSSIASTSNIGNIYFNVNIAAGNSVTIEQIGIHEGSFCLDGVNDSIEFANNINAGKQVLMNMIGFNNGGIIFDSRGTTNNGFAIYASSINDNGDSVPAYKNKNVEHTYIDGIENQYINYNDLKNKTHVAVCTRDANSTYAVIGCNKSHQFYANVVFWDCVLFPEISTPAMITSHSKYVGIKPKITVPPYYWDAYGKANNNTDDIEGTRHALWNKANMTDAGQALTCENLSYDEMSGYGGYSFKSFDTVSRWNVYDNTAVNGVEIVSRNGYSVTLKKKASDIYAWQFNYGSSVKDLTEDLKFKFKCDKTIKIVWQLKYQVTDGEAYQTETLVSQEVEANTEADISLIHKTAEQLTELGAIKHYYLIYFNNAKLAIDEEYTITMLPTYPNSIVLDGIEDYLSNANVPVLTDFTLVIKALKLTGYIGSGGCVIRKGVFGEHENTAFIYALDSTNTDNQNTFWSFGSRNKFTEETPLIGYMTKLSCNGNTISTWNKPDTAGLIIGKWSGYSKIAFYKAMLYPKTITNLEIMFLKNLFERDEIIDLTNPIFIQ